MKKHILIAAAIIAACIGTSTGQGLAYGRGCTAQDTTLRSIWTPRKHQSVFTESGRTFTVELEADQGLPATGWHAHVENDLNRWPCEVVAAARGSIDRGTRPGWLLTLRAAADVPPELFTLEVQGPLGGRVSTPRSVHVVPDLEADFYILHQSDQHLTLDAAAEPGGRASTRWGHGSKEALQWVAPVVNLINPRLVFETGDNMHLYNMKDDWCGMDEAKNRVDRFFDGLSSFAVPTVLTTGNHDIGWSDYVDIAAWRAFYNDYVGQRAFSFRMGSMYVLSSEWTTDEYLPWARADYARSWRDTGIHYRMQITHFYDGLDGWTTAVPSGVAPPDLVLVGHNHRTRILQAHPYPVLSVGSAQDHQRASYIDFKRTATGWTSAQPAAHADSVNVFRLLGPHGAPTVSAAYLHPNDGRAESNEVTVTNALPMDFYDGRIRFLMAKGDYAVSGGQVLSQYDTVDGRRTAVLVKVDLRGQATTHVRIYPNR